MSRAFQFFFPDSQDQIYPYFDFQTERWPTHRVRQRDDLYAHEVLAVSPYDGILVSKAAIDGFGSAITTRYTDAQRRRLFREGVHRFFRLARPGLNLIALGDCGAFAYLNENEPPYTPEQVLQFYADCDFDLGIAIDHLIPTVQSSINSAEVDVERWVARQELTLDLAGDFLRIHKSTKPRFEAIGVAQGWSPQSYAYAVKQLQRIGYTRIAIGGLVPVSSKPSLVMSCLEGAADAREPGTTFHLLGLAPLGFAHKTSSLGISSFDTTSPFTQAFKDATDNYHTPERNFRAIRVPQVAGNVALRRKISSGAVDHDRAVAFERIAMDAVGMFDRDECRIEDLLHALRQYYNEIALPFPDSSYSEVLRAMPWRTCECSICREIGIQVVVFRGTERNKRRGFHNLFVFRKRLDDAMGRGSRT